MKPIPGPASPRYRALLQLLRAADTLWDASRGFFERWKLSPSQFNVLNLLHLNPAGLSQTDLSRFLIVHRSNVTGLADRLEKRGLLRREAAMDRRAYRVLLTPAGRRLIAQILPAYYEAIEEVWRPLSDQRVNQMTSDLERIASQAKMTVEILRQD